MAVLLRVYCPLRVLFPLPEYLKGLEEKGLLKRGEKPLPKDFWDLPADPRQPCVRRFCASGRKEGEILGYLDNSWELRPP